MSPRPCRIQCSKCGAPGTPETPKCLQCGSRVIKICGTCGFQNSLAKNYCDSCGDPQVLGPTRDQPSPAPPPEAHKPPPQKPSEPKKEPVKPPEAPPKDPPIHKEAPFELKLPLPQAPPPPRELDLPRTRLIVTPDEPPPAKPPAREKPPNKTPAESAPPKPKPEMPAAPTIAPKPRGATPPLSIKELKAPSPAKEPRSGVASTLAGLALLVLGGAVFFLHWQHTKSPKALLQLAAKKYLGALQAHDYDSAYSMLSWEARKNCTLEDFKKSQDSSEWNFGAIGVDDFSKERALVRYNLQVGGGEVQRDWLRFVWEDDKWARAYWWNLSAKVEDALEAQESDGALAAAQAAVKIDPDDPMARGYLCESAYAAGDSGQAERECLQTLELVKKIPSDLDDKGLYHIHAILGDLYKNRLARYPEAIRHFDILLALPGLDPLQQCEVYSARAETRYFTQEFSKAIADFKEAGKVCTDRETLEFARRGARILQGEAGPDAVAVLKYQHMPDGKLTYFQWRQEESDRRMSKAKTDAEQASVSRTEETWVPEYVSGSLYKVSLRDERHEILGAQVDLWTRKVKVDIHVQ